MRNVQLRSLVLLACAPLALAGCVDVFFDPGEPDPIADPPVPGAEARFTRDVYPILTAHCASCHGDAGISGLGFVGKTPAESYDRILASPGLVGNFTRSAPILNLPAIGHKGVVYTPAERDAITAWLDAELADRGGSQPPPLPPPSIEALLQTWSGCLDYDDFLATDMTAAWNALAAASGSKCTDCHTAGAGGFTISSNPMEFFRLISTRRTSLLTFFRPDPDRVVMLPNDPLFVAVGGQAVPHNLHPAFTYGGARTALAALADRTAARLFATPPACSPPRLED